ncbi:LSU ribosomal protein L31p [Euzebya pacifica]|jgi:large subunit ribosomal protein L31|uniref:50S ribosomal protein L31 n=1 Tax=Euzebya pacifica TaxID=1608957 RepID=A0A346XYJ7_9ACTN|nr:MULTISPECIES: type B 50S ribosomal protein L31 [Euzebya]AXV07294.1 LSU ribosomal protein L31p [Euzebya pacifica]
MKADIHPEYRPVVFQDTGANGWTFITRSTIETSDTIELDGTTYPLKKVDISAASHPYYTGKMKMVDTAGRVDRYNRRYAKG